MDLGPLFGQVGALWSAFAVFAVLGRGASSCGVRFWVGPAAQALETAFGEELRCRRGDGVGGGAGAGPAP